MLQPPNDDLRNKSPAHVQQYPVYNLHLLESRSIFTWGLCHLNDNALILSPGFLLELYSHHKVHF